MSQLQENGSSYHTDLHVVSTSPSRIESYLPASTIQSHASNLLLLENGDLLCAWFGGSQEGTSDISIYLSRLPAGSKEWTPTQQVSDDPNRSEQNPVLFKDPESSDLWIFYTAQEHGHQNKAIIRRRISKDNGMTWSSAVPIFEELGAFVRQPLVVLDDKTWVLPIWYCRSPEGTQWNGNDDIAAVRYSKDRGATWQEKLVPDSQGAVHMNIRRVQDGTYVALYRSRWADNIYRSTSQNGLDWTKPLPITLRNPNSGICFDVLPDGRLVIVFNDSSATEGMKKREGLYDDIDGDGAKLRKQPAVNGKEAIWGAPRSNLCLGLSEDQGMTWKYNLLEAGDGFCMTNNSKDKINRELSYPSIAVASDNTIHIAFTYFRQRIKYIRVDESFVTV